MDNPGRFKRLNLHACSKQVYFVNMSHIGLKWILKYFSTILHSQFNYHVWPVTPFKWRVTQIYNSPIKASFSEFLMISEKSKKFTKIFPRKKLVETDLDNSCLLYKHTISPLHENNVPLHVLPVLEAADTRLRVLGQHQSASNLQQRDSGGVYFLEF